MRLITNWPSFRVRMFVAGIYNLARSSSTIWSVPGYAGSSIPYFCCIFLNFMKPNQRSSFITTFSEALPAATTSPARLTEE